MEQVSELTLSRQSQDLVYTVIPGRSPWELGPGPPQIPESMGLKSLYKMMYLYITYTYSKSSLEHL